MSRLKILVFGYLPPPYFGPSVTYQALLRSEFPQRFDITFVDISVSKNIADIERFQPGKLVKQAGFLMRELWLLATRRFEKARAPLPARPATSPVVAEVTEPAGDHRPH